MYLIKTAFLSPREITTPMTVAVIKAKGTGWCPVLCLVASSLKLVKQD